MSSGTVIAAGPMSGYGVYIDVKYWDGSVSRYGHLSSVSASVGQQVAAGDVVALSGNTGRSTGPHLHMEIRPGGGGAIDRPAGSPSAASADPPARRGPTTTGRRPSSSCPGPAFP